MRLKQILHGIKILNENEFKNVNIEHISNNTNIDLRSGLYICLKGENVDGHNLKTEAQKRGAIAFLVEEYDYDFTGIQILVKSTRKALSVVAYNFYGAKYPKIVGVTGTNGKTTTTTLTAHILKNNDIKVGLIGTEGIFYGNKKLNLNMTTPDPIKLFEVLADMYNCGVEYAIMEVSAHSIFLGKTFAIDFFIKALTNITQDHLDFFKTFSKYKNCKLDFIKKDKCAKLINIDDIYGEKIAKYNNNYFTYSINTNADFYAKNISNFGKCFELVANGNTYSISTNLIGKFNVSNVLCAFGICKIIGVADKNIIKSLQTFKSVDGRLNAYYKNKKMAIIDFAHTPDALGNVLCAVREITKGKVFCVFGCGGNRDSLKRSIMGKIASEQADFVVITNDNPRFEQEYLIADQIASGIKNNNYKIILNRDEAIKFADENMQAGDCVVICGKGAENYMEIKGVKYPYLDKNVLLNLNYKEQ